MPKDAALARDLVAKLNATYTGLVKNIVFTYDAYVDLDQMPNEPVVFVTLMSTPYVREARNTVRRDLALRLTMISDVGPEDNTAWVEQYIESFDMMVDLVFKTPALGLIPVSAEVDDRYDVDRFHSHHRLVMDIRFNYYNI